MNRFCVALLILLVAGAPLFASDSPIRDSITKAAQSQAPAFRQPDDSGAYLVSGASLLAAGITLEILSFTSLQNYAFACNAFACAYEYSTNRPIMFTGLAVGTVGGVLLDVGLHKRFRNRPSIDITPRGWRVNQTLSF